MKTAIVGLLGAGILATSLFGDRNAEDLYHDMEENDINSEELYYWGMEEYINMEGDELAFNVFKYPEQHDLVILHNKGTIGNGKNRFIRYGIYSTNDV